MRLVLIDSKNKTATVYEKKVSLAVYTFTDEPFSKEDIEQIRIMEYKDKA